jgi:hypothetical protein
MSEKPAIPVKATKNSTANASHLVLQSKGGVGKTLVSAILAQYFQSIEGCVVKCVDTDPVNQTFTSYKALDVKHVNIMDGSKIDERKFDVLMERLLSEEGVFIIDNGASSFVPMSNYLIEHDAINMLQDAGREVFVHSVITGSQGLVDTVMGFKSLAQQTKSRNIVVWLNEFFGPIVGDGKMFPEMKVYTENAEKVRGMVRLQRRNADTFGKDIELMAGSKLTFKEVAEGSEFSIMAKQRIVTMKRDLFTQLNEIGF